MSTLNDSQKPSPPPIADILGEATAGLTFMSETDAPLTPFVWPQAGPEVSAQSVREAARLPADAAIEERSLQEFFAPATAEEEWQNEDERATARRFQALVQVLEANLQGARVFRVGEVSIDVYIVGRAGEGLAGLQTKVIET